MSQVFEGYERQFCELLANLSRKCTSASVPLEDQKKQQEIAGEFDEAETLMHKMDLEARSMPFSVKPTSLAKIREYRNDLNNLKTEFKKLGSNKANHAARIELLESRGSDPMQGSSDQREKLIMSTDKLNKSSERIKESRRMMLETEEIGASILQNLHQQRESLQHANTTLQGANDNAERSNKILGGMLKR